MSRRSPSPFAPLLLILSGWGMAHAAVLPSCTGTYGIYDGGPTCVDLSISGLSLDSIGVLPLGQGTGSVTPTGNDNIENTTYADVATRVTISQAGSSGGYIAVSGIDGATGNYLLTGELSVSLNLLLEDIDPTYNFAMNLPSISSDFVVNLGFSGAIDLNDLSIASIELAGMALPLEIPLGIDVNGNGPLDAMFIDSVNLTALDSLLLDLSLPADGYGSATFTFGAATGTLLGRVQDSLTDPPFELALAGSAVPSSVPAPASLWLLAVGGLLATLGARLRP